MKESTTETLAENGTTDLGLNLQYDVNLELMPARLRAGFTSMNCDRATRQFLEYAKRHAVGYVKQGLHTLLRQAFSDYDVHALLNMYPMYVLGTEQWRRLLRAHRYDIRREPFDALLDIGAGRGDVTQAISPLFHSVAATEASRWMAWRLKRRGITCYPLPDADATLPGAPYDVISCLNVLDRCARPLALVRQMRHHLRPEGALVLAIAFPYRPCVYHGAATLDPLEPLSCNAPTWEHAAASFIDEVEQHCYLRTIAWTRTPYLCAGNPKRPYFELDDLVVVCRPR